MDAAKEFYKLYSGPLLSFWITGGGFDFLSILRLPGCSNFLYGVEIPYSPTAINGRLTAHDLEIDKRAGSCSILAAIAYVQYLRLTCNAGTQMTCVAVTAALTTNRYRRGDNRAYIAILHAMESIPVVYKLTMMKPTEEIYTKKVTIQGMPVYEWARLCEDRLLSLCLMQLLTNTINVFNPPLNSEYRRSVLCDTVTIEALTPADSARESHVA